MRERGGDVVRRGDVRDRCRGAHTVLAGQRAGGVVHDFELIDQAHMNAMPRQRLRHG
jgi:hypothetical protein